MGIQRKKPVKFILITERKPVWTLALKTATVYLIFGLSWILFSDIAVQTLITNIEVRNTISIIKGFVYVLLSARLIYLVISTAFRKLSDTEQVVEESRNELKTMAFFDSLTSLPNRRRLIERFPDYVAEGGYNISKAILFIDVDNIKIVNDTMGHVFGDELIFRIGERLHSFIALPDELYRLGGDEFVVLARFEHESDIMAKCERILRLFDAPFTVDRILIHSTVSVGVALWPLHSNDSGELIKYADIAMYQAKKEGKNRARLFSQTMMSPVDDRMKIGENLHAALLNRELEVQFQPQIDFKPRKIAGFEALLRWKNPALGSVPPDKFIPVAEETHLIVPIGEWVLEESCRFLARLQSLGFRDLSMSVNVSALQLLQDDFASVIVRILKDTKVDSSALSIELTETVMIESYALISSTIERIKELGIGIALDDFGKGYSSLSYLSTIPITILKIDKTFVDPLSDGNDVRTITGNIVDMGKNLGLTVIAEGVETEEQFAYLARRGCNYAQGWLFSKALPAREAEEYAKKSLAASPAT